MSIRTILVPQDGSEAAASALDTAFILAKRFKAHLEIMHVRGTGEEILRRGLGNFSAQFEKSILKEIDADAAEESSRIRTQFEEFCKEHSIPMRDQPRAKAGVSAAWREVAGRVGENLVRYARVNDAIVAARPVKKSAGTRRSPAGENLEALLLESGRPIVMAPPVAVSSAGEHIVIGWNGSAEAARAVSAAMPWLELASRVTILASAQREGDAQELARHLSWHGVEATLQLFEKKTRTVGKILLEESTLLGADLLVIGGYSHARARQLLFGGVTRYFFANAELPILMAH